MIQDIYPHRFHNEFKQVEALDTDTVFVFYRGKVLARREGNTLSCPCRKEISSAVQFVFTIDEKAYFISDRSQDLEGYEWVDMRTVRRSKPKVLMFAIETALHLKGWYDKNRFCGHCGRPMEKSDTERAMVCPHCHNTVYPTIAPAVIVGVIHKDAILMTRYADRNYKHYALVAGFCEIGETPEQTVKREVMEETGVKVKDIRYYKSQPWGFASNLLLGFFARLDGDDQITLDRQELSEARFVKREDIDVDWDDVSLTNEMIIQFKQGKTESL